MQQLPTIPKHIIYYFSPSIIAKIKKAARGSQVIISKPTRSAFRRAFSHKILFYLLNEETINLLGFAILAAWKIEGRNYDCLLHETVRLVMYRCGQKWQPTKAQVWIINLLMDLHYTTLLDIFFTSPISWYLKRFLENLHHFSSSSLYSLTIMIAYPVGKLHLIWIEFKMERLLRNKSLF